MTEVFSARFPHSDICGSMDICSSPQLFAAYHVFRRLLVPRHPPCALISLTIVSVSSDSHILCIALHRIWCLLVFSAFVNLRINRYLSITFCLDVWHISHNFRYVIYFFLSIQFSRYNLLTDESVIYNKKSLSYHKSLIQRYLYINLSACRLSFFFWLAATYSPMPSPA